VSTRSTSLIEFPFSGLENTVYETKIRPGFHYRSWNATSERRVGEARGGLKQFFQRSGFHPGDVCLGAGIGRFGTACDLILFIRRNGQSTVTVYCVSESGAVTTHTTPAWTARVASPWSVHASAEYLYCTNADEGLWRKRIGDTSEASWRQVPTVLQSITRSEGEGMIDRPSEPLGADSYPRRLWSTTTETLSEYQQYGGTSSSPTLAITNGNLTLTFAANTTGFASWRQFAIATFASSVNWLDERYFWFEAEIDADWGSIAAQDSPSFNFFEDCRVYVSSSATAVPGLWSTQWKQGRLTWIAAEESPNKPGRYVRAICSVDLDSTHGATGTTVLNQIRKLAIGLPLQSKAGFQCTLSHLHQGGVFLNKPYFEDAMTQDPLLAPYAPNLRDLDYVITSYNSTTALESSPTPLRIQRNFGYGLPVMDSAIPLGAWAKIELPAPAPGYDRTRLYRKRHSDSGNWWLLEEVSAAQLVLDARVDAANDPRPWNALLVRPSDHDFGTFSAPIKGQCLAFWKGHLAVGAGPEVYLSYALNPTRFVNPVRLTQPGAVDLDDPTLGRTLHISNDLGDHCLQLVAQDHLYAVGNRGVYVMMGDSALTASPFRHIPGSLGALGPRAACAYRGGVLVAARTGLYFYRANTTLLQSSVAGFESELVSSSVTESYDELLLRGASSPVVVFENADDIWVLCGSFYLKRSRVGTWETGQFSPNALTNGQTLTYSESTFGAPQGFIALPDPTGTDVTQGALDTGFFTNLPPALPTTPSTVEQTQGFVGCLSEPGLGLLAVSRTGIVFRMDRDINGRKFRSDAGYGIPWVVRWPGMELASRATAMNLRLVAKDLQSSGSTNSIRLLLETFDGKQTKLFGVDRPPGTQFNQFPFGSVASGFRFTVAIGCGSGSQLVERLEMAVTASTEGNAN